MARPTSKPQLIDMAEQSFSQLFELIRNMPSDVANADFIVDDRDKNLRDILIHLYEWHQLLLNWVNKNQQGQKVSFLPEPYNWKNYPQMNIGFWQKHQQTSYVEAEQLLQASHRQVMILIDGFSDEALFTKKYFTWTGTTSLGSYCVSATSSHYVWAISKIKKHLKQFRITNK